MNVLILTTGSVSAYLSDKLHKLLLDNGHEVKHYATSNAEHMIANDPNPRNRLITDIYHPHIDVKREILDWRDKANHPILHIDRVNWADVCVVCPADFNVVGKMANGIADDLVSSILAAWLGSGKKLYICEAMNTMMYRNPIHLANVKKLNALQNVQFIDPTVKKLACGDYGIGGLADVKTIANIIEGHVWKQPIKNEDLIEARLYDGSSDLEEYRVVPLKKQETFAEYLPRYDEPGAFGAKRKFDRHEGVDIYCRLGSEVSAVEDGVVVDSYQYTGSKETGDWWNPTWCLKVQGKSGIVTYGELEMPDVAHSKGVFYPEVGATLKAGDFIGIVGRVLKENKLRPDIRHHSTSMLHVELRTENCHLDGWNLGGERDKRLLDPTPYLKLKR